MTKHEPKSNTNFWFGFALGSITLTAVAYLMGTKKGREKLKQLIEYADTMQDMPEELFALLPSIREMLKKSGTGLEDSAENVTSIPQKLTQTLESVMEKVKNSAEEKKEGKKYFMKSES